MVKLSIVIPYYETYELTCKLLDRLVPQLTDEVEILLIDDGCKESRLDKYKDVINIEHLKTNTGGAGACNVGIEKAKGKYIGFIDSDDMISKDYIKVLINAIDTRTEDVIFMDWQDMASGNIVHHPYNYAPWKAIYHREIIPRFIDGWIYSYDVPFWEELNKKEYTRYDIGKVLYYYNSQREGNLTSRKEKIRRESMIKCEVIEKFSLSRFNEIEELKRVSINKPGFLFVGDTFLCEKDLSEYLLGNNPIGRAVVKVIEVIPKEETKEVPLKTKKTVEKKAKKK